MSVAANPDYAASISAKVDRATQVWLHKLSREGDQSISACVRRILREARAQAESKKESR